MVSINVVGAGWSSAVSKDPASIKCDGLWDFNGSLGDEPAEEELEPVLSSALSASFSCFSPIFADF